MASQGQAPGNKERGKLLEREEVGRAIGNSLLEELRLQGIVAFHWLSSC